MPAEAGAACFCALQVHANVTFQAKKSTFYSPNVITGQRRTSGTQGWGCADLETPQEPLSSPLLLPRHQKLPPNPLIPNDLTQKREQGCRRWGGNAALGRGGRWTQQEEEEEKQVRSLRMPCPASAPQRSPRLRAPAPKFKTARERL